MSTAAVLVEKQIESKTKDVKLIKANLSINLAN